MKYVQKAFIELFWTYRDKIQPHSVVDEIIESRTTDYVINTSRLTGKVHILTALYPRSSYQFYFFPFLGFWNIAKSCKFRSLSLRFVSELIERLYFNHIAHSLCPSTLTQVQFKLYMCNITNCLLNTIIKHVKTYIDSECTVRAFGQRQREWRNLRKTSVFAFPMNHISFSVSTTRIVNVYFICLQIETPQIGSFLALKQ